MLDQYCNWCNWCKSLYCKQKKLLLVIIEDDKSCCKVHIFKYSAHSTSIFQHCIASYRLLPYICMYVKLWSEIIPDIVINEGFRHILCELAPDFLYWFILWLTSSISVLTLKISRTRQDRHQLCQNKLVPINLIFTVSSMLTYIHKYLGQCITIAWHRNRE